jgi:ribosomal protein S8
MSARFPALMAVIRDTLNSSKLICGGPSNKFSRAVLAKLRSMNYIAGFSFDSERNNIYRGFPRVVIFLKYNEHMGHLIQIPRLFPRTNSNFHSVSHRRLLKLTKKEATLITTSQGLVFNNETWDHRIGGIMDNESPYKIKN